MEGEARMCPTLLILKICSLFLKSFYIESHLSNPSSLSFLLNKKDHLKEKKDKKEYKGFKWTL